MKQTIEGIIYNSEECEKIAGIDLYNNGNYIGERSLLLAGNGNYLQMQESTSLYHHPNYLQICEDPTSWLEGIELTEEQEKFILEFELLEACPKGPKREKTSS